jgi:alpha-mannosidase
MSNNGQKNSRRSIKILMKYPFLRVTHASLAVMLLATLAIKAVEAGNTFLLWQIGKPDHDDREFALAPDGYRQFREDGYFVVGQSDGQRDWPYVQPGPNDSWAGSRQHTFTIMFGLKDAPRTGECVLRVGLVDTHSQSPPEVRMSVNGRGFTRKLPRGAGDDSVFGQPAKGKNSEFTVNFPAELLKAGVNEIGITTLSGCWLLYDWIGLEAPAGLELAPAKGTLVAGINAFPALTERGGQLLQPVRLAIRHFDEETKATVRVSGRPGVQTSEPVFGAVVSEFDLRTGPQDLEVMVPAVEKDTLVTISAEAGGKTLVQQEATLKPVKKLTVYVLPHSHTDIGYTAIQTIIEEKQVNNLLEGIQYAKQTADYPEGARFVWNVEVLWAADLYLHRLSAAQQAEFFAAVKKGQVAFNGMYLNELTGLCRPEELVRLFRYSTALADRCGVTIDSAMISDVPGYTWGTVTAMAQAGIKYFSVAPNYFDRIGNILVEWENKPFYWLGPSGKEKVLVWIPYRGYAMSHIIGKLTTEFVADYENQLEKKGYPYDIAYMRWAGHGDNAVPDPAICEFVKDWHSRYAWPKFIIASTSDAFRAFEQRYGDKLPQVSGDWTPYWEDGAGSSATETAVNRQSSDRLAQAETLWAMLNPAGYPATAFEESWNNVLLYSEHTWGAYCSISEPANPMTLEQWALKQSFATEANRQSLELVTRGLENRSARPEDAAAKNAIDVFNTASWSRTELALLPREYSEGGDGVFDNQRRPVPSQRLASGELAFLVRDLPPFSGRRYSLGAGNAPIDRKAVAQGLSLDNGVLRLRVDEKTGGIAELRVEGIDANLADTASGETLNDYRYLIGDDLAALQRNGPARVTVRDKGPLVASLRIESEAPGCHKLVREVRLAAGMDYVELIDTVDKQRLEAKSYYAKEGKESIHFAFPFNVPQGEMLLDVPLGAVRPERDQMPSACKNWLTAGRWADIANDDFGVTWVTLDAPLVEVGAITATLLNSQTNPEVWRKKIERTQKLYSWAMNNHWGTNYRAYQEGPTVFRFILRPHRRFSPAEATRFATGFSQPLVAVQGRGAAPRADSLLRVEGPDVVATALKPSDDGKALIVRLFSASGQGTEAKLSWGEPRPRQVWLSDTSEKPSQKIGESVFVPAWGMVTLRAELAN